MAGTRPTAVPVYLGQLVQFGSIATPVEFFDVFLPQGYSRCQFFFSGITVTASGVGDTVSAALYVAGKFECDPVNNDTYFNAPAATNTALIPLTPVQTDVAHNPSYRAACLLDIYTGDQQNFPFAIVYYSWGQQNAGVLALNGLQLTALAAGAVIPHSHGPATLMRVLPTGVGDCNPPSSGHTINTGDWRLYAYN